MKGVYGVKLVHIKVDWIVPSVIQMERLGIVVNTILEELSPKYLIPLSNIDTMSD